MNRSEKDLNDLIEKFDELSFWRENSKRRSTPKEKNKNRLSNNFSISNLKNIVNLNAKRKDVKNNILFAHFSPFLYEVEGLGLPAICSWYLPNSNIHFTYDKGGSECPVFEISETKVNRINKMLKSYDLVIARSSSLNNMMNRKYDSNVLKNSKTSINIKTMSYQPNYKYSDYQFEEENLCPPPDPFYTERSTHFLQKYKKKNLIAVSGTLWYVKNQLKMFQQLDPQIVKDYTFVILGPERDKSYVEQIRKVCEEKSLNYYLIGSVCREMANDIKSLSKLSIISMDMRVFGQPKGYPRTLGESIGSKCLTLCNSPVTIPEFYKQTCEVYDESITGDFNKKLSMCISKANEEKFIENHNWGSKSYKDFCLETIDTCLSLRG